MSVTTKFVFPLLLVLLSLQKTKDKCLIIRLNDSNNTHRITNIGDTGNLYYLILEYPNISQKKRRVKLNQTSKELRKRKEINAILSTGVEIDPNSTSYNLQNRKEIEHIPDSLNTCNCATLEKFKVVSQKVCN